MNVFNFDLEVGFDVHHDPINGIIDYFLDVHNLLLVEML
jgi:hypothetical protein